MAFSTGVGFGGRKHDACREFLCVRNTTLVDGQTWYEQHRSQLSYMCTWRDLVCSPYHISGRPIWYGATPILLSYMFTGEELWSSCVFAIPQQWTTKLGRSNTVLSLPFATNIGDVGRKPPDQQLWRKFC